MRWKKAGILAAMLASGCAASIPEQNETYMLTLEQRLKPLTESGVYVKTPNAEEGHFLAGADHHLRMFLDNYPAMVSTLDTIETSEASIPDSTVYGIYDSSTNTEVLYFITARAHAHETAHAYTYNHELLPLILELWERTAAIEYGSLSHLSKDKLYVWKTTNAERGKHGPKHGCVNPYAAKNVIEDIAETFATVYDFLFRLELKDVKNFTSMAGEDSRITKKVELLHQFGFISDEELEKVINSDKSGGRNK